jgi:4-amino-4-deoxy-L-arabinose transferase-like glycosyltransferase
MGLKNKIYITFYNFYFPVWVFTISVFIIAILPSLIQDGMFIDGIQYAAISKNLANGLGTFWFPYLSENWNVKGSAYFLEHPPLVYAIQSIFFRILGDGLYTERIYCLFTAIISALLIARIWNLATENSNGIQKLSWLPILFWISMPIVFRSYQMNVLENTMGILILAAVYCLLVGLKNNKHSYLYFIFGGVFIFLSTLCKGIPGFFPMVVIVMYWLAGGEIRFQKMVMYSLVLLFVPSLLYILVIMNGNAFKSLSFYFSARLLERVQNDPVVNSHFHIIFRLIIDLLPAIVVSFILYLANRKKTGLSGNKEYKAHILFFLLIGIAGSIPLAFTLVQRDFYLAPSLPFYAVSLALLISDYLDNLIKQFSKNSRIFNVFRVLSISLFIGGLIYTGLMVGNAERDQNILHDTYILGEEIGEGNRIRLDTSQGDNWSFELYLIRYFNISLGSSIKDSRYIIRGLNDDPPNDESFKLIPLHTKTYKLYKREY